MFYAHFVLSKKGPLARVWLAAHWDKKLTKHMVYETSISESVEAIVEPEVKMALRTSGHLLLGVVRIYSRKAKYLLSDCNEAFVKIKMAFRPGVVDLPEDSLEAAINAITLPETFHDFDTTMADLSTIDLQNQFALNRSRHEDITIRDEFGGSMGFGTNVSFGHINLDDLETRRGEVMGEPRASSVMAQAPDFSKSSQMGDIDLQAPITDDGFGGAINDDDMLPGADDVNFGADSLFGGPGLFEDGAIPEAEISSIAEVRTDEARTALPEPAMDPLAMDTADDFALEPLDHASVLGHDTKRKRKRKLIVDEQKGIPSEVMKAQLTETDDIVTQLDLAPPTKKLMRWKETGLVEKLFVLPGRQLLSQPIMTMFGKQMHTRHMPDEEEAVDDEQQLRFDEQLVMEPDFVLPDIQEEPSVFDNIPEEDMSHRASKRKSDDLTAPTSPAKRKSKKSSALYGITDRHQSQMIAVLEDIFEEEKTIEFSKLVKEHLPRPSRKQTALAFFTLLEVKKNKDMIDFRQRQPYGEIYIKEKPAEERIVFREEVGLL